MGKNFMNGFLNINEKAIKSLIITSELSKNEFLFKIILASLIAAFSFVGDNNAGVLGSILLSPISAPIIGVVLGLLSNNIFHLKTSIWYVCIGFFIMFIIGVFVGLFYRNKPITDTMNSRSNKKDIIANFISSIFVGAVFTVVVLSKQSSILEKVAAALALSIAPYIVNSGIIIVKNLDNWEKNMLIKNNLKTACVHIVGVVLACGILFPTLHKVNIKKLMK